MTLSKINRILKCKITGREITIKPEKYEKLFSYYGSEEKVEKNFISYTVEKQSRNPEFLFWFENCKEMKYFQSRVIKALKEFKESNRSQKYVIQLQNDIFALCDSVGINKNLIEFKQNSDEKGGYASGILIKNIPFIKTYTITYEKSEQ